VSGINIRIGADTSDLQSGLTRSQRLLRDNARQMQRNITVAAKYTAALAAAGAAIGVHLINQTMKAVDEQSKLARTLDTTVNSLTALQIAGDRAGISQGALNSSLERFTARLGEARRGTGQGVEALGRLGLSAEELAAIPIDEQMQLIGERVRELGLDASETADLMRNLGMRNIEMVRFIREGTADIENARNIMHQFGLEINDIDAQNIERANDAMANIGRAAIGVRQAIAVELASSLEVVADEISSIFGDMGKDMREGVAVGVRAAVLGFADILENAGRIIAFVDNNPAIAQFGLLGYLIKGPKGVLIGGVIGAIFDEMRRFAQEMGVGMDETQKKLLIIEDAQSDIERQTRMISEAQAELNALTDDEILKRRNLEGRIQDLQSGLEHNLKIVEEYSAELEGQVDLETRLAQIVDDRAASTNGLSDAFNQVAGALRDNIKLHDDLNQKIREGAEAAGAEDQDDDGPTEPEVVRRLTDEMAEALRDRLDMLKESREDELQQLEDYLADKQRAIEHDIEKQLGDAAQLEKLLADVKREGAEVRLAIDERERKERERIYKTLFGNLTSLMSSESRALFEIGKAAAISQAIISGQESVTMAYAGGLRVSGGNPAVGAAFAAAAAAATGVQISRLASTQFGSGGGTQPTTGGAGGATTATAQPAQQQAGGQAQTLLVQGDFSQDQLFTGSTVRKLIESIAEQQRDGFTVVV
jgi:hypothetical protein